MTTKAHHAAASAAPASAAPAPTAAAAPVTTIEQAEGDQPADEPKADDERHPALAPDGRGDPDAVQNRIDLNDPTF